MKFTRFKLSCIYSPLLLVMLTALVVMAVQIRGHKDELRQAKDRCREAEIDAIGAKISCIGSLIHLEHSLENKTSADSEFVAHIRGNIKLLGNFTLDSYFDPVDIEALTEMEKQNEGAISVNDVIRTVEEGRSRWKK